MFTRNVKSWSVKGAITNIINKINHEEFSLWKNRLI